MTNVLITDGLSISDITLLQPSEAIPKYYLFIPPPSPNPVEFNAFISELFHINLTHGHFTSKYAMVCSMALQKVQNASSGTLILYKKLTCIK